MKNQKIFKFYEGTAAMAANEGGIMASIHEMNLDAQSNLGINQLTRYIYNVSHSVGKRGMNERNDVLLIQNLLNIIAPKSNLPHLKPDGICGHKTVTSIMSYQELLKSRTKHSGIKADGRFDPIHNHQCFTPILSYTYTIFTLNSAARLVNYDLYMRVGELVPLNNRHLFTEMKKYYETNHWITTTLLRQH